MIVYGEKTSLVGEKIRCSVLVKWEKIDKEAEIWFDFEQHLKDEITTSFDPYFALFLPLAMVAGERLMLKGSLSPSLMKTEKRIQDILVQWLLNSQRVEVVVDRPLVETEKGDSNVGCFFSGGVDSFHSFLMNQDEVTDLILVHGFDIALHYTELYRRALDNVSKVAEKSGKGVINIATNIKELSDEYMSWSYYHGAALACVGLLLSKRFKKVIIPSSFSYEQLFPWGSHPMLDELWSTEHMRFSHHGCEMSRVEKTAQCIAKSELATETLRVCWSPTGEHYNCGKCEKCIRTMIGLYIGNALDKFNVFSRPLAIHKVRRVRLKKLHELDFTLENLRSLEAMEDTSRFGRRLRRALRWVIFRGRFKLASKLLRGRSVRLFQ